MNFTPNQQLLILVGTVVLTLIWFGIAWFISKKKA